MDTKSKDKNVSLMHYLVKTVQEKFPDLLNFESELRFIEKAAIGMYCHVWALQNLKWLNLRMFLNSMVTHISLGILFSHKKFFFIWLHKIFADVCFTLLAVTSLSLVSTSFSLFTRIWVKHMICWIPRDILRSPIVFGCFCPPSFESKGLKVGK